MSKLNRGKLAEILVNGVLHGVVTENGTTYAQVFHQNKIYNLEIKDVG